MTLLTKSNSVQSSEYLAGSINVNAVLVRKELSNLIRNNLVASKTGKNGGYKLLKPATQISLADIYKAVQQGAILGQPRNRPNPACPIGKQINLHLYDLYEEIDTALMQRLGSKNLAEFCAKFD